MMNELASSSAPAIRVESSASRALEQEVTTGYLSTDAMRPLVLTPRRPDIDLVDWALRHQSQIAQLLLEHRALLFRGFRVATAEYFQTFVHATSEGPLLEYKDRSTPRHEVGQGVYVSTIYPAEQHIQLHNEGTYWKVWPLKLYFCCLRPSATGGETPTADVRKVYARIDPRVRQEFEAKQVMYVRNYNPGIGLTWSDAFQTTERAEVEAYAAQNAIQLEWMTDGRLRTRQIRPAVRKHPRTGEPVWFNHAAFFHVSSLPREFQEVLLSSYGEEGLPYNTFFGDGTRIPADMVAHIHEAYAAERSKFLWAQGDVLMLDNMSIAHAREPYTGERKVIVAMTESQAHTAA
jgi:alpha-ketoglutarate-dependent taurine dioxygenase